MAKGSPDCLNLYDHDDPRNAHRALQSAGLVGYGSTMITGVEANVEGSNQVGDTFRGTKVVSISMENRASSGHSTYSVLPISWMAKDGHPRGPHISAWCRTGNGLQTVRSVQLVALRAPLIPNLSAYVLTARSRGELQLLNIFPAAVL